MSWIKQKSAANTRAAQARNNRLERMRGNYGKMSKNNRRKRIGNLKNTTSRKNPRPLGPPPSSPPPPPPGLGSPPSSPPPSPPKKMSKFECKIKKGQYLSGESPRGLCRLGGGRRRKRRTRRRKRRTKKRRRRRRSRRRR